MVEPAAARPAGEAPGAPVPGARLLYEGKAKKVYMLPDGRGLMVFKDEVTAFNGARRGAAPGKGVLAAMLSARLFEVLEDAGVGTHYICYPGGNTLLVERRQVLPLEVIVRRYAYGSMLKRMPLLKKMQRLEPPLVELHYKSDELGDPLLHPMDPVYAGIVSREELASLEELALRAAEVLAGFWRRRGLELVDLKLEAARHGSGFIVVDELSGDTMRLLDGGERHLDKQVYRDTGSVEALLEAYRRLVELAGEPSRRCSLG